MADYDFIAQGVRPLTDPTVQMHNAASAVAAQEEAKNAIENRRLLKQKQTENDLQIQGQQRALYEQGVIQAGVARNGGDIGKALQDSDVVANVNPATVLSMGKLHGENAKLHSEAEQHIAKAGMDNAQTGEVVHKYLGGLARGVIQQEYSPEAITAMLTHAANFGNGVYRKEAMQAMQAIQQNPQMAKQIVDQIYQSSPIFAEDQKLANEKLTAQGHADQGTASLGKAQAEIPGMAAKSKMEQRQAELMDSLTPEKLPTLVNSVIDPAAHPELNKRTMAQIHGAQQLGLGPQALQAILKDSADQIGRTETAVATAKATAPIKIQVGSAINDVKNPIPGLEDVTRTTGAGRQYLTEADLGKNPKARAVAQKAGIPIVDKATGDALTEVDNARQNLSYMMKDIGGKLATDPNGRMWSIPANTIEKLAQTDPTLAAIGTYRTAAIQGMRAVAGSKGLRINKSEIEMAQENDIPKMTDTLPVAQKKIQNMMAFLDNVESSHLVRDRSKGNTSASQGGSPKVRMLAPNGSTSEVDASQVDHYKKLGAKVIQ